MNIDPRLVKQSLAESSSLLLSALDIGRGSQITAHTAPEKMVEDFGPCSGFLNKQSKRQELMSLPLQGATCKQRMIDFRICTIAGSNLKC